MIESHTEAWKDMTGVVTVFERKPGGLIEARFERYGRKVKFEWSEKVKKKISKRTRQLSVTGSTEAEAEANLFLLIRGKAMVTDAARWNTPW